MSITSLGLGVDLRGSSNVCVDESLVLNPELLGRLLFAKIV